MFTPQKKLWSLTPRSEKDQNSGPVTGSGLSTNPISPRNGEALGKGKAGAFLEGDGVMDQESLTERVSKLENELFEYQYNMGLLLIEKKEWTLKHEELRQAIEEATDTLKREQTMHSSALSEVEKREENLKKALGVERQCVLDLEKALREMRSEYAEIKFNADSKLAEANALVTSVEEKSLEVEAKFHAADAKLAEVSRKSSEIERKLHELEAQENALRRERSLFTTEREVHDTAISKQREDLREWERKLREAEERLADGRRLLNQREERANENDNILKEKQSELEELRKKIEISNSALKNKEDDISRRLANLALKEKEADDVRKRLGEKEKQLLELEEKLNTKEKLEIQKLLDEHKSTLAEKEKEFELEMEQRRKLHEEQLKNKVVEVENKEAEVTHMEEKVKKREQAVEKKLEKVREKEMEFDSRSKALKEKENSLKVEEKNMEKDRKQMLAEKEDLLNVKTELEKLKSDTEKLQLQLKEEREQLKITEDERTELARLQSELKQEIEKFRCQNEQLMKEADGLKQEKEKFEKEWEELDDKRAEIKKEQEDVLQQKEHFEKLIHSEEERLQNEKLETQEYVQRELEALKLAKESFAASMEHEKLMLAEKSQSEKTQLIHDFEMQKQGLETEMRRKQEEIESHLHEKEKSFEQEKEMELNNINYSREVARREMEEMKLERLKIDKEKQEILHNKQHVEEEQREIKKDIEELVGLSQKLKDQREQFIKERERFIAFAEKQKNCNLCGEAIREFMLSDLHPLAELKSLEAPPLPTAAENYLKEAAKGTAARFDAESSPALVNSVSPASGTISWLRKCTSKILKFSPGKKLELDYAQEPIGTSALSGKQEIVDSPKTLPSGEKEPDPSLQVANDSFDVQIVESDSVVREVEGVQAPSVDQNPQDIPENSQNSDLKPRRRGAGRGGRPRASRIRTLKTVTDGSKTNGNVEENSVYTNDESQAESDLVGAPKNRRKRNRAEGSQAAASDNQTEGHSDSVKDGDRPKRRQRVVVPEQRLGQKRYNLRQPKKSVGTVTNGSLPQEIKDKVKETDQLPGVEANQSENVDEPGAATALPRISGGGDGDEPARSTGATSAFSADSPVKNAVGTHGGHVDTADTSVDDMVLSEEVNGTADAARDYTAEDFKTETREEDDDDDGDDDEVNHPGEVSIGKKLWTFLTT
ncbi:Rab6 GTPase-interacting protein involved in endosome-to-TGN transport [Handroanthus impetiginosus]|uniref:Rab6 GTPase-interacting protein involved in endosome-to-TGN transport n=1 Tax=Handroanthus impetiginosus TaxID=429701 RepID=A0A2G9I9B8_9LAMI|nr:Rab6 GTPase-interacting protein involved in endosome-to-TGN transport [Handroanthus impetiginosus]